MHPLYIRVQGVYYRPISKALIETEPKMTKGWIAQQRSLKAKGVMPSQATLDKIAEQQLTGGYKIHKTGQCGSCFQVKSINGTCAC